MPRKPSNPDEPKGRPYGLYLNKELAAGVDRIAKAEADGNTHAILQYAVKYFIQQYDAGKVKLKKKTVTKLELD